MATSNLLPAAGRRSRKRVIYSMTCPYRMVIMPYSLQPQIFKLANRLPLEIIEASQW